MEYYGMLKSSKHMNKLTNQGNFLYTALNSKKKKARWRSMYLVVFLYYEEWMAKGYVRQERL